MAQSSFNRTSIKLKDRILKYAGPFADISILYWVQFKVGRKSQKLKFELILSLQINVNEFKANLIQIPITFYFLPLKI